MCRSKPAFFKFRTMDFPMIPTPINPIFFILFSLTIVFLQLHPVFYKMLSPVQILSQKKADKCSYGFPQRFPGFKTLPHPTSTSSPSIAPNFFQSGLDFTFRCFYNYQLLVWLHIGCNRCSTHMRFVIRELSLPHNCNAEPALYWTGSHSSVLSNFRLCPLLPRIAFAHG